MIEQYLHYLHLKKHAVSSVGIRRVYAIRNRGCRRRREISTSCADFGQNGALHNSPSSSVLEFNIETPCLRTSTLGAQTSRTAPHSANPQIYTNPLMYPRLPSYNLNRNRNHKLQEPQAWQYAKCAVSYFRLAKYEGFDPASLVLFRRAGS